MHVGTLLGHVAEQKQRITHLMPYTLDRPSKSVTLHVQNSLQHSVWSRRQRYCPCQQSPAVLLSQVRARTAPKVTRSRHAAPSQANETDSRAGEVSPKPSDAPLFAGRWRAGLTLRPGFDPV